MSVEYITKVIKYECTPTQKLILFVLANYSDESGQSYPSHKKLCALTGLSLSAVKDNLRKLQNAGYIEWQKRDNTSNLYKIFGGSTDGYGGSTDGYNTKTYTKVKYILDLEEIHEIYKEVTSSMFYTHSANSFVAKNRWKELRELARKGITSPKTGNKIDLTKREFWYSYFEIANSQGHVNYLRSFMSGKPNLRTLLSPTQFHLIIERTYA
jgi:DNA-binding transcriptional MocR family regulator